ncbi:MAG: hypothetical protein JXB39_09855 [Deltaproteobacteria bacterium]|nr:hypothetical protein [Deltaproteobacteria bacterium]
MSRLLGKLRGGSGLAWGLPAAGVAAWVALGNWRVSMDDAYISLEYARHFVAGDGLVFEAGERVEGFSNPTWVLLLAAATALGGDGIVWARALGLTFHLASVLGTALLVLAVGRSAGRPSGLAAALAAGFVAVSLPASSWAVKGLECSLYRALLVGALWRLAVEADRPEARPWSAVLAGIAAITRPEAPLLVAALAGARALLALRRRDPIRRLAAWLALAAAPFLAWEVFRLAWYGFPLANTWYVKGRIREPLADVVTYLEPWIRLEWPFLLATAIGIAGILAARARGAASVLLVVGAQILFLALQGDDWMPNQRFAGPLVPLLAALAGIGAAAVRGRACVPALIVLAGLVGFQAFRSVPVKTARLGADGRLETVLREEADWPLESLKRGFHASMSNTVAALLTRVPPGATLAVPDVGLAGYATDWVIVDLAGLVSHEISGATGLDTPGRVAWLHGRRPDWIALNDPGSCSRFQRSIWNAPWFWTEYEPMRASDVAYTLARRLDSPPATPEEVLAGFERAVDRAPGFLTFHLQRMAWAAAVGSPTEREAACADLVHSHPTRAGHARRCAALLHRGGPLPIVADTPIPEEERPRVVPVGKADLWEFAEWTTPTAVRAEGDRIVVEGREWNPVGATDSWGTLLELVADLEPLDLEVDGIVCDREPPGEPDTCGFTNHRITFRSFPWVGPPDSLAFRVTQGQAAEEAGLRSGRLSGRRLAFAGGPGLVVRVPPTPPGTVLRVRLAVVPSPVFAGRDAFRVTVTAWSHGRAREAWTAWSGSIDTARDTEVRVPLDVGRGDGGTVIRVRAQSVGAALLGPLPVVDDLGLEGDGVVLLDPV